MKEYAATLAGIRHLTHDIRMLSLDLDTPLAFWAGQYVDITIPGAGITRSFSMANPPAGERQGTTRLDFVIKKYADGAFSALLDGGLTEGMALTIKGPYGTCLRRENRFGPMILVGGGSGMSPLLSILSDLVASGEQRPVRFFYGARGRHVTCSISTRSQRSVPHSVISASSRRCPSPAMTIGTASAASCTR